MTSQPAVQKKKTHDEIIDSFWGHLETLRSALIRSFIFIGIGISCALFFHRELIHYFQAAALGQTFALFSPQEGIVAVCKLSFWIGLLFSSPFWVLTLLRFILPGLRTLEYQLAKSFLVSLMISVILGFSLCLKVSLPYANNYFFTFNSSLGTNLWNLSAYLNFVLLLLLAHGIAFELGLMLLILVHLRILDWQQLAAKRRHFIVFILILSALLTPPDVLTQLLLAIPLYGFFELSILYGKVRLVL